MRKNIRMISAVLFVLVILSSFVYWKNIAMVRLEKLSMSILGLLREGDIAGVYNYCSKDSVDLIMSGENAVGLHFGEIGPDLSGVDFYFEEAKNIYSFDKPNTIHLSKIEKSNTEYFSTVTEYNPKEKPRGFSLVMIFKKSPEGNIVLVGLTEKDNAYIH